MKKIKLFCLLLLIGSAAKAQMPSILFDQYNFDQAAMAHSQALAMDPARGFELVGIYRMIATASRSYRGDFVKRDVVGIRNPDQSILGLQINAQSVGNLVQVIQLNLSKLGQNQGPAVLFYSPEGTASFTQFSYKAGQVSDAVIFVSECKALMDQTLLCAKRFIVKDLSQVNPQQAAMNNTIVGYDLYMR